MLDFKKVRRPRRFTKSSRCLGHLSYDDYVARLNVESLEERLLHADLLYVYKVLNNNVGTSPASISLMALHCKHQLEVQKLIHSLVNRLWLYLVAHRAINRVTAQCINF